MERTLRIGCGEWGFRELPMEQHFTIAQRFGFRYLEFGIGGGRTGRLPENPSSDEIEAFIALAEHYQIRTPFCCIENDFTLPNLADHEAMLKKVLRQMAVAAACRATHVRLFAGFTPLVEMTEPLWSQLLSALEICQSEADRLGVAIAIETHGCIQQGPAGEAIHKETVTTNRSALERMLLSMPARMGINYDPGNIKAAENSSTSLHGDILRDRINYCHMKDWKREGQGWSACAIGDDDLDYKVLLPHIPFNGVYLIEYEPLHDAEDGIRRSLNYLTRCGFQIQYE